MGNGSWLLEGSSPASAGDPGDVGLIPGEGHAPWNRSWQPTPVFLPGKSHGQRRLAGYSPWGHKRRHDLEAKQQQTTTMYIYYLM